MSRPEPNWMSTAPDLLYRVLSASQARREFGLHHEQIYAAVARGDVHAVAMPPRDDRSERGQTRYPEWELRKLAEDLGLTPLYQRSPEVSRCYQPPVQFTEAIAA